MNADQLISAWNSGFTRRCHAMPYNGEYNVAQHSWGAAVVLMAVWPEDFPRLAARMLVHDAPEQWTGDIPSPAIKALGDNFADRLHFLEEIILDRLALPLLGMHDGSDDALKLLFCDRVELWLWMQRQVAMGNQLMDSPLARFTKTICDTLVEMPRPAEDFFNRLQSSVLRMGMGSRLSVRDIKVPF